MTNEKVSAIRARLKFPNLEEFAQGYARYISAGGIFIPMSASKLKEKGERVRFQFMIADGQTALLGEGVVHQVHNSTTGGTPVGILVKFSKLSQSSKRLVDKIVAQKKSIKAASADPQTVESNHTQVPPTPERDSNATPHTQAAVERIAELYGNADSGGLEEETRVAPGYDDITPTKAIEKQEQARKALLQQEEESSAPIGAQESFPREDTVVNENAITAEESEPQDDNDDDQITAEANGEVTQEQEKIILTEEAKAPVDDITTQEAPHAEKNHDSEDEPSQDDQEPPQELSDPSDATTTPDLEVPAWEDSSPNEDLTPQDEDEDVVSSLAPQPPPSEPAEPETSEDLVFLSDEESEHLAPADDAPTSLDPVEISEAEEVVAEDVIEPPRPLTSSKAVLPPPPMFNAPDPPSGLQRLSEASTGANELADTDFVMDPDELDDFFPSSGGQGSTSLFNHSSPDINLKTPAPAAPKEPEPLALEPVTQEEDVEEPQSLSPLEESVPSPDSPSGNAPKTLASTEGGLQVLAYDEASEAAGLDIISLGEEEGDIDLMFEGIFSGSTAEDDEEDFFGDIFSNPSQAIEESTLMVNDSDEAPSNELVSLLDAIDDDEEELPNLAAEASSTPSIQLQHSVEDERDNDDLNFDLPEQSSVSEADALENILGEEASVVPEEPTLTPEEVAIPQKKKKGLFSKIFGKED